MTDMSAVVVFSSLMLLACDGSSADDATTGTGDEARHGDAAVAGDGDGDALVAGDGDDNALVAGDGDGDALGAGDGDGHGNAGLSATRAPGECQADLQVLREESIEVREHPLFHKGDFFGQRTISTADGDKIALLSLATNAVIAVAGQAVPEFGEDAFLVMPLGEMDVAPDYGDGNSPDYPIVFRTTVRVDSVTTRRIMYRANGQGGLVKVIAADDELTLGDLSGSVSEFFDLRLASEGALFFSLRLEGDDRQILVRQDGAGAPLVRLLAQHDPLPAADAERFVGPIGPPRPNDRSGAVVHVDVMFGEGTREGQAYLVAGSPGGTGCSLTDASVVCSGAVLIADGEVLDEFGGDDATFAAVLTDAKGLPTLEYKVTGIPTTERLTGGVEAQGFTFGSFHQPRQCALTSALYFVGRRFEAGRGSYDELMRFTEKGVLEQITNFGELLDDASLAGEVPNEIRNWALGYNCDAVFYTWGPSGASSSQGYEGYWASYHDGATVEIIDETPGRANGNGDIALVRRARSGLDPNATDEAPVHIGPEGQLYFVPSVDDGMGNTTPTYMAAERPDCAI